jgi:aryl-alcohol dehydrogenase
MKAVAAVLRAKDEPYHLEVVDLDLPGPGEVLVRIAGTGLCHTDVVPRQELSFSPPPIITGHEGAGVVEAVGAGIQSLAVGDHVVLSFDFCGACQNCGAGVPCYCDTFLPRNLLGRRLDGTTGVRDAQGLDVASRWFGQSSFATHSVVSERSAVVVPRELPLEIMGPLGCGFLTGAGSVLVALDVQAGNSFAVFGTGAVGLAAVMAAKIRGAHPIIAVDLHQHRLDLAQDLGASHVLRGSTDDVVAALREMTAGGVDVTFDTTGNVSVMSAAVSALRMNGRCGFVGIQTEPLVIGPGALTGKTVTSILEGGADPQRVIPQLVNYWQQGCFPFERLIQTYPLADINAAERDSASGAVVKPVLIPPDLS